jgi:hypothetical protein
MENSMRFTPQLVTGLFDRYGYALRLVSQVQCSGTPPPVT